MSKQLTEDEERLVADFAIDYSDRWREGERVSMQEYLIKLPGDRMREEFREIVNMSSMLTIMEDVKSDR